VTGKLVNLNRFKKQKARASQKARAYQNAVLHGMPKSLKTLAKSEREAQDRSHAGNKLLNKPDD